MELSIIKNPQINFNPSKSFLRNPLNKNFNNKVSKYNLKEFHNNQTHYPKKNIKTVHQLT